MQAVFQDPASSFNPRQTVGRILLAEANLRDMLSRVERLLPD